MSLSLAGVTKALFGGSDQSAQSQQSVYGPQNNFLSGSYYPGLSNLYKQYSSNPQSLVAPFTQAQQQAQNYGMNYAGSLPGLYGQSQGMMNNLASPTLYQNWSNLTAPAATGTLLDQMQSPSGQYGGALNKMMSGQVNMDPYNSASGGVADQMTRAFNNNIMPSIRRNSLAMSGVPTSRTGIASQNAADTFEQNLGSILSNMYLPAYQQSQNLMASGAGLYGDAMNRNLSAANSAYGNVGNAAQLGSNNLNSAMNYSPMLANLGLMPYNIMNDIGGQQQTQNQNLLSAPFNLMGNYQSLAGNPTVLGQYSSSGNTSPGFLGGFGNFAGSVFGGGSSSAAAGAKMYGA